MLRRDEFDSCMEKKVAPRRFQSSVESEHSKGCLNLV